MNENIVNDDIQILSDICHEFGLKEYTKEKYKELKFTKEIKIKVIKGFLINEDKTYAIWHHEIDNTLLPIEFQKLNKIKINNLYLGKKYLLVLSKSKTFAFNINYYNIIINLIDAIKNHRKTYIKGKYLLSSGTIFLIETNWFNVVILGLKGTNYDEEERIILSKRLSESTPFFALKELITINWNNLKKPVDSIFQDLSYFLLKKEDNIMKVVPIGKSKAADRGRDFDVIEREFKFGGPIMMKWLVQCKYSKKSISPNTIKGWTDRIREHGYKGYWLLTNNDITPSLFDQFKGVEKNSKIKVKYWQRLDFDIKLNIFPEIFKKFFINN